MDKNKELNLLITITKEDIKLINRFPKTFRELIIEVNAQLTRPIQRGHVSLNDAAKQSIEQAIVLLRTLKELEDNTGPID